MTGPNEVIHQSTRLKIMATLRGMPPGELVEFTRLKAILGVTDGNLGTHLNTLEQAGYVEVEKDFAANRPRTRVMLSKTGRRAFEDYVAYLQGIIGR